MKTLKYIVLVLLLITFSVSLYYFIYCVIYNRSEVQTWQMPVIFALCIDMILML